MPDNQATLFSRFWAGLQGTELRLWHMIVAAIFTTVVTTGAPIVVAHWDKKSDQISERSNELNEVASDFENNVNKLVNSGVSFDALKPEQVASLSLNVEQQIRSLNRIRPVLVNQRQKDLADEYATILVDVRNMLQDGLNAENTVRFGLAAQKLTLTRDQFVAGTS